jgi:hypothetical protein
MTVPPPPKQKKKTVKELDAEDAEMLDAALSPPPEEGAEEPMDITQIPDDTTLPSPLSLASESRAGLSAAQQQLLKKALTISEADRRKRYQDTLQGLAATAGPLMAIALVLKRLKSFIAWLDDGEPVPEGGDYSVMPLNNPWLALEPRFLPIDLNKPDQGAAATAFLEAYMRTESFWEDFRWAARVLAPLDLLSHSERAVHQWIESVLVFPEFDIVLTSIDIRQYARDMGAKQASNLAERETELRRLATNTDPTQPKTQAWLKKPVYWGSMDDITNLEAKWKANDALITPGLLQRVRAELNAYDASAATGPTAYKSRLILGRMIERRNWSEPDITLDVLAVADPVPETLPEMGSRIRSVMTVSSPHIVESLWMTQFGSPENVARLLGMLTLARQNNNGALSVLFRYMVDYAFNDFGEKRDFVPPLVFDRHTTVLMAKIIKNNTHPTRDVDKETVNMFDATGKNRWYYPFENAALVQNRSNEVQILAFILFGVYPPANQARNFHAHLCKMKRDYQERLRDQQQDAVVMDADHPHR